MTLRAVEAMTWGDIQPGISDTPYPTFQIVDPQQLRVDESYQRNLSERSIRLIRALVAHWDWRAFKPPTVVAVEDYLEVIDGQHTALAAASNPLVGKIPVIVVDAPAHADRAAAFVRLNRDRINVTGTQLHRALAEAGDVKATALDAACLAAGARILKAPAGAGHWKIGETVAVATLHDLMQSRGADRVIRILEVLVRAQMAPLPVSAIRAVDALLNEPEYQGRVDVDQLVAALANNLHAVEVAARRHKIEHGGQAWRGMTIALFRRCGTAAPKSSPVAKPPMAHPPAPAPSAPVTRTSRAGEDRKPPPDPGLAPRDRGSMTVMLPADDRRLRDLVGRKIGLQACATTMHKTYETISAAMDRLGLSKVKA